MKRQYSYSRPIRIWVVAITLVALSLGVPALSHAETREESIARDQATQIYDSTMSPYCPGRTLSGCPSEDARQLRDEIYRWIVDGSTEQEVRARLKMTYGAAVTGALTDNGGAVPTILAVSGFCLIGLVGVFWFVKGRSVLSKPREAASLSPVNLTDDEVERELRNRIIGRTGE